MQNEEVVRLMRIRLREMVFNLTGGYGRGVGKSDASACAWAVCLSEAFCLSCLPRLPGLVFLFD